jgi:hypothetical protein
MPRALVKDALSHWHKPYGDFQTSTMEFYASVEGALQRCQVPDISTSRVGFHEGGGFSAKREYLRVERKRLTFDLCAAPFGAGYFFSWWLSERRGSRWLAGLFVLLVLVWLYFRFSTSVLFEFEERLLSAHYTMKEGVRGPTLVGGPLSWLRPLGGHAVLAIIEFVLLFPVMGGIARVFGRRLEDAMLGLPLIGPLYDRLLKPMTYYRIDTILMFQSQVQGAVNEAIDALLTTKGLRVLTEDEKQPVMREFLRR